MNLSHMFAHNLYGSEQKGIIPSLCSCNSISLTFPALYMTLLPENNANLACVVGPYWLYSLHGVQFLLREAIV